MGSSAVYHHHQNPSQYSNQKALIHLFSEIKELEKLGGEAEGGLPASQIGFEGSDGGGGDGERGRERGRRRRKLKEKNKYKNAFKNQKIKK